MDIAGHVVYFDRNVKSIFTCKPASQEIISGKGIKENMKIPLVDFKVTNTECQYFDQDISFNCVSALFLLLSMLIDGSEQGRSIQK
jgi:hypothetical protein